MFLFFLSHTRAFTKSIFQSHGTTTVKAQNVDSIVPLFEIPRPYVRHIREAYLT